MMDEIFADTSGRAAFFVRTEPFHSLAQDRMEEGSAGHLRVVTTNYILAELVPLMTRPFRISRPQQIRILESIRSATWVEIVHVDPSLDAEAWTLFRQHADKNWSPVDCASFALMRRRGITEALTSDHHFEQAGFVCLLK
jgi:predicted nucleic acid-binding protein